MPTVTHQSEKMMDEPSMPTYPKKMDLTQFLLACGIIGPLLFIVVFLIEGATRPGYSAWRTDVSYLALSNQGWEQITNFLVCGALLLAFAIGLHRAWRTGRASVWGPLLVGLFGLSLIIAGVFVADPGGGYPPGAPLDGRPQTWHGWVHGINGMLLFNVVLPVVCFVLAKRFAADPSSRRWAIYSRVTGILLISMAVLDTFALPFALRAGFPVIEGLIQRTMISMVWIWLSLVGLHVWREWRIAHVE